MELLQLKYFCDAAESQNFSATAGKFYVPPSAVSQSIKRLEAELGVQLFIRQANRVKLNRSGEVFYEKVKGALALIEDGKREISDHGVSGRIKLSIFINRRIVMQTVEKFSKAYPDVDIVTKYSVLPDAEELDLIVTDLDLKSPFLVRESLLTEEILLAMRDDHPLASRTHICAEDIRQEPFVCTNQSSSLYHITDRICGELGFSPRIVICSDDPYYIRKCIELGLGVALIPACSWQGQFSDRIVLKKLGEYCRTTYVYRNARQYIPKCVKHFLSMLHEECAAEQSTEP